MGAYYVLLMMISEYEMLLEYSYFLLMFKVMFLFYLRDKQ